MALSRNNGVTDTFETTTPPLIGGVFFGKDFVSIGQIQSLGELQKIFDLSGKIKERLVTRQPTDLLKGHTVVAIFYESSTRTSTSFEAAAWHLGANILIRDGMQHFSSVTKGENLADTIRTLHQTTFADAIILRHPDNDSSEVAAFYSDIPIINAGSGVREHPTQAVLDLYTIYSELGGDFSKLSDLRVTFVGDMKHGRTIKSLGSLLALVNSQLKDGNIRLDLVSPEQLMLSNGSDSDKALLEKWRSSGLKVEEHNELNENLIKSTDVMYVTRVQKERFEDEEEYMKVKDIFRITPKTIENAPAHMLLMHPLPRVNEISLEIDKDPRAVYIRKQMRSGLYTRMALLSLIMMDEETIWL